jgi:phage antirepressor YoqD-like protein
MGNELKVVGKQMFMGIEIPVIEGGFGNDKRVTTVPMITSTHGLEAKVINQSIKRLIEKGRIKENVDYIDLFLSEELKVTAGDLGLITSNGQKNAFILSERGYSKLIKYMDDDESWDTMDKFIDEYFEMRSAVKSSISEKDLAIIAIVNANSEVERALAINKLESLVAQPLIETIEKQKPMAALAELRIDKKGCYSITDVTKALNLKKGQITRWAKAMGYIHKKIQEVNQAGEKFFKVYSSDSIHNSIGVKEDGLQEINNKLEEIMAY